MVLRMASKSGRRSSPGVCDVGGRGAGLGVGVKHREVELIFFGVEIDEQIVDFVEDFLGAGVGAVDFVDDENGRELGFERLAQHVTRLRERAFAGIDQEHHAIDHFESAFDFSAEVAVAGRVDDVDLHVVIEDGGVFGEDGDAALALEFVGVHDALDHGFVRAEGAALAEHGVDQRGLAVVDVRDDGDIADGRRHAVTTLHDRCVEEGKPKTQRARRSTKETTTEDTEEHRVTPGKVPTLAAQNAARMGHPQGFPASRASTSLTARRAAAMALLVVDSGPSESVFAKKMRSMDLRTMGCTWVKSPGMVLYRGCPRR